ncbi:MULTISPECIES: hypothetical protein, partial [unclassified Mesorhizobium]
AANANGLRWRAGLDWCGDLAFLPALRRFAACGPDDRSHSPASMASYKNARTRRAFLDWLRGQDLNL